MNHVQHAVMSRNELLCAATSNCDDDKKWGYCKFTTDER